jgi:fatty-acyl-CoA synthase
MVNIIDSLRFWSVRTPERPMLVWDGKAISWQEMDRRTDELAAGFVDAGVKPGDRVGILMRNRIEFPETMLAAMKAGAAVQLLNPRFTPAEMVYPIEHGEPRLVVASAELVDRLADAAGNVRLGVYVVGADSASHRYEDLRRSGMEPPAISLAATDAAMLSYTSGTTGRAKGAVLTHGSLVAGSAMRAFAQGTTWRDGVLIAQPMAFAGGACAFLCWAVIPGSTAYLEREGDTESWLRSIEAHGIASWPGIPIHYEMAMNHPSFGDTSLSSLRFAVAGGSPVSRKLLTTYLERGVPICQGYGSTETSGTYAAITFPEEAQERLGTVGRPILQTRIRVVDDDDRELPAGSAGEILLQGPNLFREYLKDEKATRVAFKGGWFHTGDIGAFDQCGSLAIVDRKKDMIISGGLNVYPAEIERVIGGISKMSDFAVVGVPDARWGEVPLLVAANLGDVDLAQVMETVRRELADYQRPRFAVSYGGPLPRTIAGKVLKREISTQYAALPPDIVDLKSV